MLQHVIMHDECAREGAKPDLHPSERPPLALSGIFWTRKWAMIGFARGAAWEGDDRQGNGLAVATRRVFLVWDTTRAKPIKDIIRYRQSCVIASTG
jgi:hypothetical protein